MSIGLLQVMVLRRMSIDAFNGTLQHIFRGSIYALQSTEQAFQRKRTDTLPSSSLSITTMEHSSRIFVMDYDPVGKESLASVRLRVVTGLVEADTRV